MLNGKKTVIGAIMLSVAVLLPKLGLDVSWLGQAISILEWLGAILSGVGIGHKGMKGELTK